MSQIQSVACTFSNDTNKAPKIKKKLFEQLPQSDPQNS